MDRLAADTPRQIANVHTFFNLANALIFIGFTTHIARLVEWLLPDQVVPPQKAMLPKHLDEDLLENPAVALEAARTEIKRLGKRVRKMVRDIMPAALTGTRTDLERFSEMDKVVDALHIAIVEYLGQISLRELTKRQSKEMVQLVQVANALEQIGDRVATGLVTSASKRIDEEVTVSSQTLEVLEAFHHMVLDALADALKAITRQDAELAREVRRRRREIARYSREVVEHGLDRMTADEPNRLRTYAREMEVMEILDSVFSTVRRITRSQG